MQIRRVKIFTFKIHVALSHEFSLKPFLVLAFFLSMANIFASEPRCKEEKITWGSALVNHTYKTVHADNFISCILNCGQDTQCRSCNFWWNELECELNFAARYSAPASFLSEVNCVHRDMDYQPDTWFVEIQGEVCMGAKDDKPGRFLTPMAGKIRALKLVYVSGKVGCTLQDTSKWGCPDNNELLTIITDDQNNVVFPENYKSQRTYRLPGITSNSPELLFTFSTPLEVTAGQEFRVWYTEDLFSIMEDDNYPGSTCMKVIATFFI